jgi:serine/threonine-protein phosphatase PGAM5
MFTSHLVRFQRHNFAALVALSSAHYFTLPSTSVHVNKTRTEAEDSAAGAAADAVEELFENQCLKRQMYVPKFPYPAWDYNWDGKETPATSLEGHRQGRQKEVAGRTRHVILIRHGQYDESHKDDGLRKLTPLGRLQAIRTGRRLKEMMEGAQHFDKKDFRGSCRIKAIRVSDMTRAKETAELIAAEMGLSVAAPDADLNEALPAPMIPIRPDIIGATDEIDQNQHRIERAFQRYFYRDTTVEEAENDGQKGDDEDRDEFEIIVCHGTSNLNCVPTTWFHVIAHCSTFIPNPTGNVIRYMFCRALQLPPEAWLRMSTFNCSLTYLEIRPTGSVSCRMLGDIGHLRYDESTFSGYHGFKW